MVLWPVCVCVQTLVCECVHARQCVCSVYVCVVYVYWTKQPAIHRYVISLVSSFENANIIYYING